MTVTVNKKLIKTFNFSGGECHVSLDGIDIEDRVEISAFPKNADHVMQLILTVDAIRRVNPHTAIDLHLSYFPYARQDRVCNPGEPLSASVMAQLINNLNCASVTIEDPHSDVTPALINNVRIISQADIVSGSKVMQSLIRDKQITLMAPDAGAAKKTEMLAKALAAKGIETDVMFASKIRNVANGEITGTNIPDGVAGKNFLIVDDICDGGRTFTELAQKLKDHGAKDIYLYITHGIFSKGLKPLGKHFTHIYCKNLFHENESPEFLTVMEDVQ